MLDAIAEQAVLRVARWNWNQAGAIWEVVELPLGADLKGVAGVSWKVDGDTATPWRVDSTGRLQQVR